MPASWQHPRPALRQRRTPVAHAPGSPSVLDLRQISGYPAFNFVRAAVISSWIARSPSPPPIRRTCCAAPGAAIRMGRVTTPLQAVIRAEMKLRLQTALNEMDPTDREVLALRHFEQLNNAETAEVLGISTSGASSRYVRALKRLKEILGAVGSQQ